MSMGQNIITGVIAGYQAVVSPLLGPRCRYHPTCSAYMSEAVAQHGVPYGLYLGLIRLLRCHPWAAGGHDPVPPHDHDHVHVHGNHHGHGHPHPSPSCNAKFER